MARKKKLPKESLITKFLKENSKEVEKRKENKVPIKQFFLIVSEGTKTEPNYFNAIKEKLPKNAVNISVFGKGKDTEKVVRSAMKKRELRRSNKLLPNFDEVYAVFDKDDFPNDNFNSAIQLAQNENIHPIYSNEAFELWFVLHFQYLDSSVSRGEYVKILEQIMGDYKKNDTQVYAFLQKEGDESLAIKRAERLLKEKFCGNPAKEKPTTRVHELVSKLNEFKI